MSGAQDSVLVTGGTGYLAGWVIAELLGRGYRVRTTVRDLAREPQLRAELAPLAGDDPALEVVQAELLSDEGWDAAVAGCRFVLHVASPFPPKQPKDPEELIVPAREGTLRVLRAARAAGVERVVTTSSVAAIDRPGKPDPDHPMNEGDWADPASGRLSPYAQSKTVAERAAWDFVRESGDERLLTTINPSAILGPVLGPHRSFSLELIERMLSGMPGMPRLGYSLVDARDVAWLQAEAMIAPQAAGHRFIAAGPFRWMEQIAEVLRDRLGDEARKVPTRRVPDFAVKLMARFDPSIKSVLPGLGIETTYTAQKAIDQLDWRPRPVEDTIEQTARSLLAQQT